MKKFSYILLLIISLFFITSVHAAELTSVTYDGNIKVEGTGIGQIQIVVFDSTDTAIFMTTTESTGTYSVTLPSISTLKNGDYKVKVADKDGSNTSTKTLTITSISNPLTYDSIIFYIFIAFISIAGIFISVRELRNRYN